MLVDFLLFMVAYCETWIPFGAKGNTFGFIGLYFRSSLQFLSFISKHNSSHVIKRLKILWISWCCTVYRPGSVNYLMSPSQASNDTTLLYILIKLDPRTYFVPVLLFLSPCSSLFESLHSFIRFACTCNPRFYYFFTSILNFV